MEGQVKNRFWANVSLCILVAVICLGWGKESSEQKFIKKYKASQVVTGKELVDNLSSLKGKTVLLVGEFQKISNKNIGKFCPQDEPHSKNVLLYYVEGVPYDSVPTDETITIAVRVLGVVSPIETMRRLQERNLGFFMATHLKYLGHVLGDVTKIEKALEGSPQKGTLEEKGSERKYVPYENVLYHKHISDRINWYLYLGFGTREIKLETENNKPIIAEFKVYPDGEVKEVNIIQKAGNVPLAFLIEDWIKDTRLDKFSHFYVEEKYIGVRLNINFNEGRLNLNFNFEN